MKITAKQLRNWAEGREAQGILPVLVRRLIAATSTITAVTMPGRESISLPGWDGLVEVAKGNAWVPEGRSNWELGCSADVLKKAKSDFFKRSVSEDAALRTFVFVTPRQWRGKGEWEKKARGQNIWRDVRAIDADDLEGVMYLGD